MLNFLYDMQLRLSLLWDSVKWVAIIGVIGGICVLFVWLFYPKFIGGEAGGKQNTVIHADAPVFDRVIREELISGDYDRACENLESQLKAHPDDAGLKALHEQIMSNLQIDFKFNYLPDRRREITTRNVSNLIVLTKKDPYYLIVHSADQCYLYLFQLQSSGEMTRLFPNTKFVPTVNPVPGGSIRIPDGYDWLYLDDIPGNETIYLLASRWEQVELDSLSVEVEHERNTEVKKSLVIKILDRLQREENAAEKLPGLVFARHQFKHERAL